MDRRGPKATGQQGREGSGSPADSDPFGSEAQAPQRDQGGLEPRSAAKGGKDGPPPGQGQASGRPVDSSAGAPGREEVDPRAKVPL